MGVAFWPLGVDFAPPIVKPIVGIWGLIFGSAGVDFGPLRINFLQLNVAFWPVESQLGSGTRILGLWESL